MGLRVGGTHSGFGYPLQNRPWELLLLTQSIGCKKKKKKKKRGGGGAVTDPRREAVKRGYPVGAVVFFIFFYFAQIHSSEQVFL